MSGVCPTCGTPYSAGDYRCDGTINGVECGKDLVGLDESASRPAGWWA